MLVELDKYHLDNVTSEEEGTIYCIYEDRFIGLELKSTNLVYMYTKFETAQNKLTRLMLEREDLNIDYYLTAKPVGIK
jgi:hypothetical protein